MPPRSMPVDDTIIQGHRPTTTVNALEISLETARLFTDGKCWTRFSSIQLRQLNHINIKVFSSVEDARIVERVSAPSRPVRFPEL